MNELPSGYHYMPSLGASPLFWMSNAPHIYVRWGRNHNWPKQRVHGKIGRWYTLPDRDVVICKRNERPLSMNFDEEIDTNPLTSPLFSDVVCYLFSQGSGRRPTQHHTWHDNRYKICSDSGGAQLRMGQNWVSPKKSLDYMNRVADIGFVLDLPLRTSDGHSMKRLGKIADLQKRIVEWMVKNKRSDLRLMNIVHGFTFKQMNEWYSRVKSEGCEGWGCTTPEALAFLTQVEPNAHIHVLGWGGMYPELAWAAKYAPCVTSDSATWGATFKVGNVPFPAIGEGNFSYQILAGRKHKGHPLLDYGKMPCSCPLCSKLGWGYVYNDVWPCDTRMVVASHVILMHLYTAITFREMALEAPDINKFIIKLIKWYGGLRPSDKGQPEPDKNGDWNPQFCPFCGRKTSVGKGSFPSCPEHKRVADRIASVSYFNELLSDFKAYASVDSEVVTKIAKASRFDIKPLFGEPTAIFDKGKSAHLASLEANAAQDSLIQTLGRYDTWLSATCHCFNGPSVGETCAKCGLVRQPKEKKRAS